MLSFSPVAFNESPMRFCAGSFETDRYVVSAIDAELTSGSVLEVVEVAEFMSCCLDTHLYLTWEVYTSLRVDRVFAILPSC